MLKMVCGHTERSITPFYEIISQKNLLFYEGWLALEQNIDGAL